MNVEERHQEVTRLFQAACELPLQERVAFLLRQCPLDADLRAEVEAMLRADDSTSGFLESPLDASVIKAALHVEPVGDGRAEVPHVPARVGHYKVLDVLGRGGTAIVYLAEQKNPARRVALKVLRPGFTSRAAMRRLEEEARFLARLQHSGIAQVFEAGVSVSDGIQSPFFAMEFVDGKPLGSFAKSLGLGTRKCLELMLSVCEAVEHAHQRGIIHRDLKPSNILVDKCGKPKVLDFGIARATDCDVHTTTLQTDIGQLIGTIPYMSPEQTLGQPDTLDTRSDIYALGVVSYELLTDRLPYNLDRALIHEAVRVIREVEPARPSSALPALRGDVETILLKALEKQPARRYQTISEFAADIRRYLRDEPIQARPPSVPYQLRKFASRNRQRLRAAALGACLTVFLGALAVTYIYVAPPWIEYHVRSARLHLLSPYFSEFAFMAVQMDKLAFKDKAQWRAHITRGAEACERAIQEYDRVLWANRLKRHGLALRLERESVALGRAILINWDTPHSVGDAALAADARALLAKHAPVTMRLAERVLGTDELDPSLEHEFINANATPLDLRSLGLIAYLCGYPNLCSDAWIRSGFDLADDSDPLVDATLGQIYLEADDSAKAYTRLDNAARAFPESKFITIYFADAAIRCGDLEVARRRLARAQFLPGPDYYDTGMRVQADLHAARGELAEALDLYEQHLGLRQSATTQLHYLRLLNRMGDHRKAAEFALELSLHRPDVPEIQASFLRAMDYWWESLDETRRGEVVADGNTCLLVEHYRALRGNSWASNYCVPMIRGRNFP